MNSLTERIQTIDGFVWQPFAMPVVLVLVGALLTLSTGLVQIRRFPLAVRFVLAKSSREGSDKKNTITPFQALATALASSAVSYTHLTLPSKA